MGVHPNFHATFKTGAPKVRGGLKGVEPLCTQGGAGIPTYGGDRGGIIQPFAWTIKIDDRYRRCLRKAREGERRNQESRRQQGYGQPFFVVPHLPFLIWSLLRLLLLARAWHHRHMLDRDLAISPLRGDQRAAKAALQIEYDATTRHRARGFHQAFGGGIESLL